MSQDTYDKIWAVTLGVLIAVAVAVILVGILSMSGCKVVPPCA